MRRSAHLRLGRFGEHAAVRSLLRDGYRIRARNWRDHGNEADIIASRSDTLVLVEVKTSRRAHRNLSPLDRIGPQKWRDLSRMLDHYRCYHERRLRHERIVHTRIDAIGVTYPAGIFGLFARPLIEHHLDLQESDCVTREDGSS